MFFCLNIDFVLLSEYGNNLPYSFWKILAVAGIIALWIAWSAGRKQEMKNKKREQHRKSIAFKNDKRPVILYLRSFCTDGIKEVNVPLSWGFSISTPIDSFEMKLENWIKHIGPFYAIGEPGKIEKDPGAVRAYYEHNEWKAAVLQRMQEASIIIFRPYNSEGTAWEFSQLVKQGHLTKTIIAVKKEEINIYNEFKEEIEKFFPGLPEMRSRELYICIDESKNISFSGEIRWTPVFLKESKRVANSS